MGLTKDQFEAEMRITMAIRIYETGAVSSGWAADFAGLSKMDFLDRLSETDAKRFSITPADLRQDVAVAQRNL